MHVTCSTDCMLHATFKSSIIFLAKNEVMYSSEARADFQQIACHYIPKDTVFSL
jgi:hypothetical protein